MHMNAKSMQFTRHAHVGKRSQNHGLFKFWARDYKNTAKRQDWASFLREQNRGLLAELHSAQVEKQEAEDAAMDEWVRKESAAQDEDEEYRRRARMNARWLENLGEGTLFWHREWDESWTLCRVCYSEPDAWYDGDGPDWYTQELAQITLSRDLFAWVVTDYTAPKDDDDDAHALIPLMDTSLEVLQTTLMVKHILTNT
jgi:hypothetical protein